MINTETKYFLLVSKFNDESAFVVLISLISGIFFALLSLIWLIHMILYFLMPLITSDIQSEYAFISNLLEYLSQKNLSFISFGIYAVLSLYLLICIVKGCVKVGMRFIFLVEIHPLIKGETFVNSLLFNINVILFCGLSVIHFLSRSFKNYLLMTDVDLIFNQQIGHLNFFRFFFENRVFEIAFIGVLIFTGIIYIISPNENMYMKEALKENTNKELI